MRLMIRKVQYAPEKTGPAPTVSVTRDFLMSDKPLHVEASLQKQVGYVNKCIINEWTQSPVLRYFSLVRG